MRMAHCVAAIALTLPAAGLHRAGGSPTTDLHLLARRFGLSDTTAGITKCGFPVIAAVISADERLHGEAPVNLLDRPVRQTDLLRGAFRVHFDTTGPNTPALLDAQYRRIPGTARAFADSVAEIASAVLSIVCGTLGYDPPPGDGTNGGGPEYDIYIEELGNLYGITTPETALPDRRYLTFLTVDNDFAFVVPDVNKGLPGLRVTLAHEFHHAIQLGSYGFWGFDDIAFHEMSSTWIEDAVYPDVNDYYNYVNSPSGHFHRPEAHFLTNDIIMYSRAVWCQFLAERYTPAVIRLAWEALRIAPSLAALDAALSMLPAGGGFRAAFAEWTLWNYFTGPRAQPASYYAEGGAWPPVVQRAYGFAPPARSIPDSLDETAARYHQILYAVDTLTLALANTGDAIPGDPIRMPYTYLLDIERRDPGYRDTPVGIFVKLETADPAAWHSWEIVGGGVIPSGMRDGLAFPNPFRPSKGSPLSISVPGILPVPVTLSVYTPAMDLVYRGQTTSFPLLGKYVIQWNGRKDNDVPVESGVYFYVLEVTGQVLRGKFAVLQE